MGCGHSLGGLRIVYAALAECVIVHQSHQRDGVGDAGFLQVHFPEHRGVEQRDLLLVVEVVPARHVALLIDSDGLGDGKEGVEQRLIRGGLVDGRAEGLDEPGASLTGPEAKVVPKRGLE